MTKFARAPLLQLGRADSNSERGNSEIVSSPSSRGDSSFNMAETVATRADIYLEPAEWKSFNLTDFLSQMESSQVEIPSRNAVRGSSRELRSRVAVGWLRVVKTLSAEIYSTENAEFAGVPFARTRSRITIGCLRVSSKPSRPKCTQPKTWSSREFRSHELAHDL